MHYPFFGHFCTQLWKNEAHWRYPGIPQTTYSKRFEMVTNVGKTTWQIVFSSFVSVEDNFDRIYKDSDLSEFLSG